MRTITNLSLLLLISSIILNSCSTEKIKMEHIHAGNYLGCTACKKNLIKIDNNEPSQISTNSISNNVSSNNLEENNNKFILSASSSQNLETTLVKKDKVKINLTNLSSYKYNSSTDTVILLKQKDNADEVIKAQNKKSIWAWIGFIVAASGIFFLLSESALIVGPISFILCIIGIRESKKGTIARKFAVIGLILSILSILVLAHYLIVFVYMI